MTNEIFEELKELFSEGLPKTLAMNHYDLAQAYPDTSSEEWREFLTNPEIEQWITTELSLIQNAELSKIITSINQHGNSVGRAQIINSLVKLQDNKSTKEGPIFIYTHVPLDKNEQQAPNTEKLKLNIFEK